MPKLNFKTVLIWALVAVIFFLLYVIWIISPIQQPKNSFTLADPNVKSASYQLKAEKRIHSAWIFSIYVTWRGWNANLYEGNHLLKGKLTPFAIARLLHSGDVLDNERIVTFPEGYTTKQIAYKLQKEGIVDSAVFLSSLENYRNEISDLLGGLPKEAVIEGVLFPDTYRFYRPSTADKVIRKMIDNFKKRALPLLQKNTTEQLPTANDILTLASIVEKELRITTDRKKGANVFIRRLQLGMRLQSDVTVLYGAHSDAVSPFADDLATNTPYNTYTRNGLPVGPIDNPGLESIQAVIDPIQNEYLYFLAASDGKVYWAKTLEEHNFFVQKYLR